MNGNTLGDQIVTGLFPTCYLGDLYSYLLLIFLGQVRLELSQLGNH